jgi:cytochrome c-type biogenesis protein CcmH/NrfF
MEEYSLTLGAHLLLWVFPLVLVVLVIVEDLLDRFKPESER